VFHASRDQFHICHGTPPLLSGYGSGQCE